jgi:hypothetical protein
VVTTTQTELMVLAVDLVDQAVVLAVVPVVVPVGDLVVLAAVPVVAWQERSTVSRPVRTQPSSPSNKAKTASSASVAAPV